MGQIHEACGQTAQAVASYKRYVQLILVTVILKRLYWRYFECADFKLNQISANLKFSGKGYYFSESIRLICSVQFFKKIHVHSTDSIAGMRNLHENNDLS